MVSLVTFLIVAQKTSKVLSFLKWADHSFSCCEHTPECESLLIFTYVASAVRLNFDISPNILWNSRESTFRLVRRLWGVEHLCGLISDLSD